MITFMRVFFLMCLLSACSCPAATPVDSSVFAQEQEAACAAVPGCDLEFLRAVPVSATEVRDVAEVCGVSGSIGCYCTNVGCVSMVLYVCHDDTCRKHLHETALHEYTHAAFDNIGQDTHDHPPAFWAALETARAPR